MIGENITAKYSAADTSMTAGGSGDDTAITGVIIDRDDTNYAQELTILVKYSATLAQTATLKFKSVSVQHDDASNLGDAAAYATLESETGSTIATGPTGGATLTGVKKYNVHLGGAKRYVRFDMTPDLSAANTDTAKISSVAIFAGENQLPAV